MRLAHELRLVILVLCIATHLLPRLSAALFEQCNHQVDLKVGEKIYINSPFYPNQYPAGTACRYLVTAPEDYKLNFKCKLDMGVSAGATRCSDELFFFNRDGSELFTGSDFFCGSGSMERRSFLNRAVISYISTTNGLERTSILAAATVSISQAHKHKIKHKKKKKKPATASATRATTTRATTTTTTSTTSTTSTTTAAPVVLAHSLNVYNYNNININHGHMHSFAGNGNPLANTYDNGYNNGNNIQPPAAGHPHPAQAPPAVLVGEVSNPLSYLETVLALSSPPPVHGIPSVLPMSFWRNASHDLGAIEMATQATLASSNSSVGTLTFAPIVKRRSRVVSTQNGDSMQLASVRYAGRGGKFSCLVEVVETDCDCGWMGETRSSGNRSVAAVNEFPPMAGVRTVRNKKIFCGASIIHHRYLISAAHCFASPQTNRAELINVVVGEHDFALATESFYTRTYALASIIVHEQFRTVNSKVFNDIALLRTRQSISWNRGVGPACLPFLSPSGSASSGPRLPLVGQQVDAAGWGTITFGGPQSTALLKTTLDVISNSRCKQSLNSLPHSTFCTFSAGRDTCQFESGGALYLRNEALFAVGIVSYGPACGTQLPSVNTKVALYLRWIRNKTPEVVYCVK